MPPSGIPGKLPGLRLRIFDRLSRVPAPASLSYRARTVARKKTAGWIETRMPGLASQVGAAVMPISSLARLSLQINRKTQIRQQTCHRQELVHWPGTARSYNMIGSSWSSVVRILQRHSSKSSSNLAPIALSLPKMNHRSTFLPNRYSTSSAISLQEGPSVSLLRITY